MRSPFRKLRNVDSSPAVEEEKTAGGERANCTLYNYYQYYIHRILLPSRKVTTRSRMSSALLEVKVYSSPLMVAKVKL
ncbi:hypothetical protein EYF80_012070 [Liparis tanakae]|uniref:Uncharacterized protein n=1 Tax=Liparis tanakae TaxID=230148 RepID=A0A4Z2IKL4_9TELE|nr:hypothetical protein EYF80_012070 [Liparis tanakae]